MSLTQVNIAFLTHRKACKKLCGSDGFGLCREGLRLLQEFQFAIDEGVVREREELRKKAAAENLETVGV